MDRPDPLHEAANLWFHWNRLEREGAPTAVCDMVRGSIANLTGSILEELIWRAQDGNGFALLKDRLSPELYDRVNGIRHPCIDPIMAGEFLTWKAARL